MSLTNPNTPVSQQDLQDFYHKILPYIGGSSGGTGGGHTIEDAEGTDLTQRDTLQFGEGFLAEDDDTNQKTVITPDVMQSGDMDEVISPLPSVQPRYHKYSTEEHIVGEWIDGKPIYEKTIDCGALPNNANKYVEHNISNLASVIDVTGVGIDGTNSIPITFCWTDTINSVVAAYVDGNNIIIGAGMNRSSYTAYITLRYTKSE